LKALYALLKALPHLHAEKSEKAGKRKTGKSKK
jgi:hypothetical protein